MTAPMLFDALELQVIGIASQEPVSSLDESGMGRATRWIFGWNRSTGLANARLEILRRLVVRLHHDSTERADEAIRAAQAAGFSAPQISVLTRQFARRRARTRTVTIASRFARATG
ncbi:hypothetical protein ACPVPU_01210 [Sphingomonas sp. CJ99]